MTTRRRRQGSESEPLTDIVNQQHIVKGPSSVLHWNSEVGFTQPSFYLVSPSEENYYREAPVADSVKSKSAVVRDDAQDMMASPRNMMTPAGSVVGSTSRDRTMEFMAAVRSLQNRQVNGVVQQSGGAHLARAGDVQHQQYTEFMRVAKVIGKDLSNTYTKLEKLTLLAKKRSLFDDRPQEIQELTYIIREDITNLNKQIGQLKNFVSSQQNQKHNTKAHSTNVVVTLQSKLASMSSEFKQVLEVRTENLKAQRSRREQFTGTNPVVSDLPAGALTGGPLGSQNRGSVLLHDELQAHGGGSVAIDMGGLEGGSQRQQQMFTDETDSYLQSRSDAVQSIESTIVELGGIFQQLALMVREQQEMVERIDSNVDDAHLNVEAAHDELLRYFRSVSSSRWLMLKIFGVVIVFVIIFAIFLA